MRSKKNRRLQPFQFLMDTVNILILKYCIFSPSLTFSQLNVKAWEQFHQYIYLDDTMHLFCLSLSLWIKLFLNIQPRGTWHSSFPMFFLSRGLEQHVLAGVNRTCLVAAQCFSGDVFFNQLGVGSHAGTGIHRQSIYFAACKLSWLLTGSPRSTLYICLER